MSDSIVWTFAPKQSIRTKYKCWYMDDPDNVVFTDNPNDFQNDADRKVNKMRGYTITRNDAPSDY